MIHAVGNQYDRLAPDFGAQLLGRRQVDCIEEDCATRLVDGWNRTGKGPGRACPQLQVIQTPPQQQHRVGGVLEKFGLRTETHQERHVLLAQHLSEELIGGAFLHLDEVSLAATDVHQQAERQGQVRFTGEVPDVLRLALFGDREVVLGKVRQQGALAVANRAQDVDHVDADADGGNILGLLRQRQPQRQSQPRYRKSPFEMHIFTVT